MKSRQLIIISLLFLLVSIVSYAGNFRSDFHIEVDKNIYKYNDRVVTIEINGTEIKEADMPAIILDGRTLVPVREVFESKSIGASVEWNEPRQEVIIKYENKTIVLTINSKVAYVNNVPVELDVPAKIIRDTSKEYGKTMIPIRFVSEQMGYNVGWNESSYRVSLSDGEKNSNQPPKKDEAQESTLENIKSLPTQLFNSPISWTSNVNQDSNTKAIINKEENETTTVNSIRYVETTNKFIISATSPITFFKFENLGDRFLVDVENAIWGVNSNVAFTNNTFVSAARSSQFSNDPMTTRIVFDYKAQGANFDVELSEDRTQIILSPIRNQITEIKLGQNNRGDYITVSGTSAPVVEISRLSNPNRIVIDLANADSLIGTRSEKALGQYVKEIRTSQFTSNTTRIVLEVEGMPDFSISNLDSNTRMIQLYVPSYKNISYENTSRPIIKLNKGVNSIPLNNVEYKDNYLNREYVVTLSGDYSELFGSGEIKINDTMIDTINVGKDSRGNTRFVIKGKTVYEYRLVKENNNLVLKGYKPRELYSQIVVIDTGHGGKDPGAVSGSAQEKALVLNKTLYLKEHLDGNNSIKTYYTRIDDTFLSLAERCRIANDVEADFLISIHNNSATSKTANGTETLYKPNKSNGILDSHSLAKIIQAEVLSAVGLNDRGLKARNDLYILNGPSMPSVIVEVGFMSNANDLAKITQASVQQKAAKAIYDGIVKTFSRFSTGR